MRRITIGPIATFATLAFAAVVMALAVTAALSRLMPTGEYRGIATFAIAVVLIYVAAIGAYRLFLAVAPLAEGPIQGGSRDEFVYHVYLLFYLLFFQPLIRSLAVPVPLMRLIYLALGARLGEQTYSAGVILDPPLTRVGAGTIIGHDAVLFSHAVEGDALSLASIRIGNRVTIGAKAVIMPGVTIDDGALVAVGAVVSKGTHIGPGEVWGGTPARRLHETGEPTPEYRTARAS